MNGPPSGRAVALVVGAATLAASIAALFFALRHAPVVPFWDDWIYVPIVCGREPFNATWLWSLHNEHRIPLPKLIEVLMDRATGMNASAACAFNVGLLVLAPVLLLLALRARRGRLIWTDAAVPLLFLHWGHGENLGWPFQIAFILPVLLLSVVTAQALRRPSAASLAADPLIGACVLALPLCGAAFLPAAGLLALAGIAVSLRPLRPRAMIVPILVLAISAAYAIGFRRPSYVPPSAGIGVSLAVSLQSLAGSLGSLGELAWPGSGALALLALLIGAAQLRRSPEREQARALLLLLAALVGVSLTIGFGRSGLGNDAGFIPRYATLTCLFPFIVYASAEFSGTPAQRRALQVAIAGLVFVLYLAELPRAWSQHEPRRRHNAAILEDLRAGLPLPLLTTRHRKSFDASPDGRQFREGIRLLAAAGFGPFRSIPAPAPTPLDAAAEAGASLVRIEDGRAAIEIRPGADFLLPLPAGPQRVSLEAAVRLQAFVPLELELELLAPGREPRRLWAGTLTPRSWRDRFDVEGTALRFRPRPAPWGQASLGWVIPTLAPAR